MTGYLRPDNLSEALSVVNEHTVMVAGATDVYPAELSRHAWGHAVSKTWLDLSAIHELHGVQKTASEWRIGALTTWAELLDFGLPRYFDGLLTAAKAIGGAQIQNRATLVGNVCNASPAADGIPPLLCLRAEVELVSIDGVRKLALSDFVLGNRRTAIRANELVSALMIPRHDVASKGYFYKLGAREYLVISIVMVSAVVTIGADERIADIRIAIGACSAVAQRLHALEADLIGQSLDENLSAVVQTSHLETLAPIDDVRADARYRHHAAGELLKRLFKQMYSQRQLLLEGADG